VNPGPRADEIQSLHFESRNPAKSMKTSQEKKFNRYTFTVLRSRLEPFHESLPRPRDTSRSRSVGIRDTNSNFATGIRNELK
jgi:hypothetical protein